MDPIGWGLVALAWGWAVGEFLLLDPLKLGAYRLMGRHAPAVAEIASGRAGSGEGAADA